jgi:hypothetical protein
MNPGEGPIRRWFIFSTTVLWSSALVGMAAAIVSGIMPIGNSPGARYAVYLAAGVLIALALVAWTYRLAALLTCATAVFLLLATDGVAYIVRRDPTKWPALIVICAGLLYMAGWYARWSVALKRMRDQLARIKQVGDK